MTILFLLLACNPVPSTTEVRESTVVECEVDPAERGATLEVPAERGADPQNLKLARVVAAPQQTASLLGSLKQAGTAEPKARPVKRAAPPKDSIEMPSVSVVPELKQKVVKASMGLDIDLAVGTHRRLGAEEIRAVVSESSGQVRACYERALKSNPRLSGRVVVAATVGGDGAVDNARTHVDQLGDTEVVDCIVQAVSGWRFPEGRLATNLQLPFFLRPGA